MASMQNIGDLGDHIHLGSRQPPQTLQQLMVAHTSGAGIDPAFKNLHVKLSTYLNDKFKLSSIPLPGGLPIHLPIDTTVIFPGFFLPVL